MLLHLPLYQSKVTYIGCYRDKTLDRALKFKAGKKMSLNNCIQSCKDLGFLYAGRQYLGECYCGNADYDKHGQRDDCSHCDSDNVGGHRNCVYSIDDNFGFQPTNNPTISPIVSTNFE